MSKILVLAEHRDGELEEVSRELLAEARRLVSSIQGEVVALLLGSSVAGVAEALVRHGAHKVFVADDPRLMHYDPNIWLETVIALCQQQKPDLILIPATSSGEDVAARLAVAKNWPLLSRSTKIKFRENRVEVVRPLYGGKLQESTRGISDAPCLVTVMPGVIGVPNPGKSVETNSEVAVVPIEAVIPRDVRVKVTGFVAADPDSLDLTEADIIVAAGRGLGHAENVALVQELAVLLGGAVGSTRVVVDLGWLGRETQVGQTGTTVKPRLYIACGISGATQHTIGMKESALIIAINTDPVAPIFNIADLALKADVSQLLPLIIERCRDRSETTC